MSQVYMLALLAMAQQVVQAFAVGKVQNQAQSTGLTGPAL